MPLFNETPESIAEAIVTVKRALKAGVIEKADYKGLSDYLDQRAKDFGIDKKQLAKATKYLKIELELEAEEFFTEEGDALYNMADVLLDEFKDFNGEEKPYNWGLKDVKVEPAVDKQAACEALEWLDDEGELDQVDQDKQAAAYETWMKMDDDMRAAMAVLASNWQMGRTLGIKTSGK
jgi:hypothetical protein